MIRPCDNCGGDGYQVGPPTPCPRCADMPKLYPGQFGEWYADQGELFVPKWAMGKHIKPDPDSVMRWCFTHEAQPISLMATDWCLDSKWSGTNTCVIGWVKRPTRLEEVK